MDNWGGEGFGCGYAVGYPYLYFFIGQCVLRPRPSRVVSRFSRIPGGHWDDMVDRR
jgi:hypothetical protein